MIQNLLSKFLLNKYSLLNSIKYLKQHAVFLSCGGNPSQMKALKFDACKLKLEFVKTDVPEKLEKDDVLVQVCFAGVCGTDIHIIDGEFPIPNKKPIILGHEFAGIIARIGKNVKHVKIGDKVAVECFTGCTTCWRCRSGKYHYCKKGGLNAYIGMVYNGGWAQYCRVPKQLIQKLPECVSVEQGVLVAPMANILHAWDQVLPVPIGKRILVLGAGSVGSLFCSLAHMTGHRKVTVSEPSADRRKNIEKLETNFEILSPDELKQHQECDDNYEFDIVFDTSGNSKAIEHAFTLLDYGGKMCLFGCCNPEHKISISPFKIFERELRIVGGLLNPFSFPKAVSCIETMGERYITYDKLGVQTFALEDFKDAIACTKDGAITKAVFKIEH